MKTHIRELEDRDRRKEFLPFLRFQNDLWEIEHFGTRPMSKRLPSPYTETPTPKRDESSAMFAGACFILIGAMASVTGLVTWGRWIWEAVR